MSAEPSKEYMSQLAAFEAIVSRCTETSQAFAGIKAPSSAHYYASLLFTSLCTRSITLLCLAPHSSWSRKRVENWDFASAAGITRSLLEVRLAFFYLCIEKVDALEWDCRWNTLNLSDCTSRIRLFESMPDTEEVLTGFAEQQNELRQRLTHNGFFQNLDAGLKKRILNGQVAYLHSLEEVASRAGIEVNEFRLIYKLFSSQVHGLPLSFYRMAEQNRGRGIHSESEEGYTVLAMDMATQILEAARAEMHALFDENIAS